MHGFSGHTDYWDLDNQARSVYRIPTTLYQMVSWQTNNMCGIGVIITQNIDQYARE